MVREEQPKKLSTHDRHLRGDIETIVLHALEKDRDRRYQSAIELSSDIKRYMDNRPIHARPPSMAYTFRTFVKRNKIGVAAVAAVFIALVSGIVEADGEMDHKLYFDKRSGRLKASRCQGDPALTRYLVRERVAGNTLLECRPDALRHEQVRLHLTAIGHPLTVDPEFGGGRAVLLSNYKPGYRPNKRCEERPLVERLTLHVESLTLEDPRHGQRRTFSASPSLRSAKAASE